MEVIIKSDELTALLNLLDDPDEEVYGAVSLRLVELGHPSIIELQTEVEMGNRPLARMRAADIIHAYQDSAISTLTRLLHHHMETHSEVDLQEAMLLLDAFGNPGANRDGIGHYLDHIALRVHELFIKKQPANDLTHVLSITTIIYDEEEFHGAAEDFYDPANSYLSTLIDRKSGIPISLAAIVMMVAERVGLNVKGVALPFHFLVRVPELEIMLDPYSSGTFVTREDCVKFMERSGTSFSDSMLEVIDNNKILLRMIRNLILAHQKHSNDWEAQRLATVLSTLGVATS